MQGRIMKLSDIARVIRSKNAGPRTLTIDILFDTDEDYQAVASSEAISSDKISALYQVPAAAVRVIPYPVARAIKISLPRWCTAGSPGDRDVYGAQQHVPLLKVEI